MHKVSKNTAEYKKPGTRFGSVARSFVDANSRYQALAVASVGRAVEIQSQFIGKAYASYVAEASKIGRMFFAGYNVFIPSPRALPPNLNERKAADGRLSSAKAKVNSKPRRRAAAQNMSTKRKIGTVTKTQISKRSAKMKHRSKG